MKKIGFLFCFLLLLSSCVKNLDFNQVDQLELTPVYEFSPLFATFKEKDFVDEDTGAELISISDEGDITIFEESYFRDNVQQVIINYELDNKISRGFELNFDFLDNQRNVVFNENTGFVPANTSGFKKAFTINVNSNSPILNTKKLRFRFSIGNGLPLDPTSEKELKLKTAITIKLKIK